MTTDNNDLLCVVSLNEKGFWQCDVYRDYDDQYCIPPDWFCTGKIGEDSKVIIANTEEKFPGIRFVDGVSGYCEECGEPHYLNETKCTECDGDVFDA